MASITPTITPSASVENRVRRMTTTTPINPTTINMSLSLIFTRASQTRKGLQGSELVFYIVGENRRSGKRAPAFVTRKHDNREVTKGLSALFAPFVASCFKPTLLPGLFALSGAPGRPENIKEADSA
ncbi:MAG: hypothetical protein M5R40_01125 [Anaerolineae bacterium]|nr:hypothetical protein [Anaerolineae bacterium]